MCRFVCVLLLLSVISFHVSVCFVCIFNAKIQAEKEQRILTCNCVLWLLYVFIGYILSSDAKHLHRAPEAVESVCQAAKCVICLFLHKKSVVNSQPRSSWFWKRWPNITFSRFIIIYSCIHMKIVNLNFIICIKYFVNQIGSEIVAWHDL